MNSKIFSQFCIALILSLFDQIIAETEEVEVLSRKFDVEPGGETKSYIGEGDGLKCEFTYACQGGTLEEWLMEIWKKPDGHYTCLVERTEGFGHSYIYFENFKLKVTGGKITSETIYDGNGNAVVNTEDKERYKKHKHSIEDGEDFEHGLIKIEAIISRKKHHEL